MGSISLSRIYARGADGTWGGYGSTPQNILIGDYWRVTYDTFFGPIENYEATKLGTWQHLYALNVTTGTAESLQNITFRLNFGSGDYDPDISTGSGLHTAIATCYVYNTNPLELTPQPSEPPNGYIGSNSQTVTLSKDGGTQTASFTISTPNAGSTLYVWVTLYVTWPVGYVDGYNVYCSHECTYYDVAGNFQPLVLSFDLAENGMSIETNQGLNFQFYNASGIALVLKLSYSGEVFHTYSISASTGNPRQYYRIVQAEWFDEAEVTHLKSMTVTFSLESADGTMTATGTRYVTVVAGNDMKPSVASLSLDVVQPSSVDQSYAGVWIAGVSRATYTVQAVPTTDAEITGVTMTCPDGTTVAMTYTGSNYAYTGR